MKSNRRTAFWILVLALVAALVEAHAEDPGQLVATAMRFSPEYTRPVLRNDGTPFAIVHELNGDGRLDVAILSVLDEAGVPATVGELTETSRLYRNTLPDPLFLVETFFAGDESVQTVELGRNPVLDTMEVFELTEHDRLPVAISVTTRSATGTERTLLIYSPGGGIQHIQLQDSDRHEHQFVDLDDNGIIDIVATSRLPEAGRGYETFMELLLLERGGYRTRASFGLVRELQRFLRSAGDMIVAGDWVSVRTLIASSEQMAEPPWQSVFVPVADDEPPDNDGDDDPGESNQEDGAADPPGFNFPETSTPVTRVVFPAVSDNPFPYPYLGRSVTLMFRVECCGGYPRVFAATVRLSANPFGGEPFAFLTEELSRQ